MTEPQKIMRSCQKLMQAQVMLFPVQGKVEAISEQGVYIINTPKNKVLHVGRTIRGKEGLNQRLQNHLNNKSSFARNYLKPKGINLRSGYTFQYLKIGDARQRALVESLATGLLCPAHKGTGERKEE